MPPAPSGATISYGPSFVPEVRPIRARNYSPKNAAFPLEFNGLRITLIAYSQRRWRKKQFVYRTDMRSHIAPLGWITLESFE